MLSVMPRKNRKEKVIKKEVDNLMKPHCFGGVMPPYYHHMVVYLRDGKYPSSKIMRNKEKWEAKCARHTLSGDYLYENGKLALRNNETEQLLRNLHLSLGHAPNNVLSKLFHTSFSYTLRHGSVEKDLAAISNECDVCEAVRNSGIRTSLLSSEEWDDVSVKFSLPDKDGICQMDISGIDPQSMKIHNQKLNSILQKKSCFLLKDHEVSLDQYMKIRNYLLYGRNRETTPDKRMFLLSQCQLFCLDSNDHRLIRWKTKHVDLPILVCVEEKYEVADLLHRMTGHSPYHDIQSMVQRSVFWYGMPQIFSDIEKRCQVCLKRRGNKNLKVKRSVFADKKIDVSVTFVNGYYGFRRYWFEYGTLDANLFANNNMDVTIKEEIVE